METSHFGQRTLIALSVLVLGATVATSWWMSRPEAPSGELALEDVSPIGGSHSPNGGNGSPNGSDSGASSDRNAVPSFPGEDDAPLKLAAYEQPPVESGLPPSASISIPPPARIPTEGVSVPSAERTTTLPEREGVIQYRGVLSFVHDVKIVAQADGVIQEFLVDEGSIVEKDAIIVEIDNRLAKAEQEVAKKELESAVLKAEDESQIKFSMASEEVAKADFSRTEDLYKKDVADINEYERKRLEWIKSGFQIDVAKREQKINQATVGVSQAKLNAAGVQVELRTIRAPFSGIVAKADRERFEWVKAGDEIMRLVSLESFRVKGRARIADSPNQLEGAPARVFIQVRSDQVETVDGVVGFVEPETSGAVDGRNEYAVWVEIPNRVVGGRYLFRGKMDATVEIYPKR